MVDEIPYTPPGAPAAPASISPATTSAPTPTEFTQGTVTPAAPAAIGVSAATPSVPLAIGTSAATPAVPEPIDPGNVVIPPSTQGYVEPLPPDYEEFRFRATYNGIDGTYSERYVSLLGCGLNTEQSGYVFYCGNSGYDTVWGTYNGYGSVFISLKNKTVNQPQLVSAELSAAYLTPIAGPEPCQLILGMNSPSDYAMPYDAQGLAASVDLSREARPTLTPLALGLQAHIYELDFLNCRLEGSWDLRAHASLAAIRFYGCPNWKNVRLPATEALEVSTDVVSSGCDSDDYAVSLGAWATFLANLPDLTGFGAGGGILGVGMVAVDWSIEFDALWIASGAANKNWSYTFT